jgi:hypothetical protein
MKEKTILTENPIGLDFSFATWTAGGAGTLRITLRHLPNKSATGVASGDITNADGETDNRSRFSGKIILINTSFF